MSAGLFSLSIDPKVFKGDFRKTLFWGTSYGQHLNGDFAGLSVFNGQKIVTNSRPGLFAPNFENRMRKFRGTEAIGYCGPAEEPFYIKGSKFGSFSICFCGNIINLTELREELIYEGHIFRRGDDIEVITKLIVQGKDIIEGISWMTKKIQGAYALLVLTPEGIFAVCCPTGQWPLVIGENKENGAVIVASECVGFYNLGFKRLRDLEPGEIVLLKNGSWLKQTGLSMEQVQVCSFNGVYTSFVNAIVHGLSPSWIRKQLGANLAQRDIKRGFIPHIVIPVPDSGRFHAIGYKGEFDRQMMLSNIKRVPFYDEYLSKYGIVRSFLAQTQGQRREKAHYKIVISGETIKDFLRMLEEAGLTTILEDIKSNGRIIIVVCDDSIVRGTQTESDLVPKIKAIFEMEVDGILIKVEIHLRISYPELLSHCSWGKTTKKGETLAELYPQIVDRVKKLRVASLEYNTLADLVRILEQPREKLCIDCALRAK